MPTVKFEQEPANANEEAFLFAVNTLVQESTATDCRTLAPAVRAMCGACAVDMVIGCGGSHIWIHRKTQFICNKNSHANNVRWAIINDH